MEQYPKVRGTLLRDMVGDGYVSVGSAFGRGSFSALHRPRGTAADLLGGQAGARQQRAHAGARGGPTTTTWICAPLPRPPARGRQAPVPRGTSATPGRPSPSLCGRPRRTTS